MAGSFLRQSTASQSRATPPFLDSTDYQTAETALTINNTDVKLIVNGGASANKNSGGGTHRANGVYGLTFDATDTATVGEMEVSIVVAGALPVFMKFWVLEEAVYDALFAASAPGYVSNAPVNVAQWSGSNVATVDTAGYPKVTIKSGTGTGELSLSSGQVILQAGTGTGQLDFTSGVVKANTTQFGGSNLTQSGGRPEVNTTHIAGTAWASTTLFTLASHDPGATLASQTNITAGTITTATNVTTVNGLAAGVITASSIASDAITAAKIATGAIDADALATDAVTEIATGILDAADAIETGITPRLAWRYTAAATAGKLSGAATTTNVMKGVGTNTDRITATVDADGNRTAITLG